MSGKPFSTPPYPPTISVSDFDLAIPEEQVALLKHLLQLSPIAPETWENKQDKFGVSREWLLEAVEHWKSGFDWRAQEKEINSFPQFLAKVKGSEPDEEFDVHFAALFSERRDAVPIVLFHGWPGSFLEFLPLLSILRSKYTPTNLPFHFIVPSLIGYGFSSPPPLERSFSLEDCASVMQNLVEGLGFKDGYVAQGGDVGSLVARLLAVNDPNCKALHLNFCQMSKPDSVGDQDVSPEEGEALAANAMFGQLGIAYAMEQGTKTSTIGLVLQSSPVGLLAWVGEKFIECSDQTPSFDVILESVSLYWFTRTIAKCFYPYREMFSGSQLGHGNPNYRVSKPLGYSWFPKEILPSPKSWVSTTGNLVFHRAHTSGGHFAALEEPALFLEDLEAFVGQVWK
ncbi:alpha/beta-hydrolase [Meredithblackwellia eburnea MCA 4105]